MIFYAMTDVGQLRDSNQDYVFASDAGVGNLSNLYIVADGMGGHLAGEYASETAVKTVLEDVREKHADKPIAILESAIQVANKRVYTEAQNDVKKRGMGTTMVAATVSGGRLYVANVGDSRLYAVSNGRLQQITRDHSVVEELVRSGGLSKELASKHKDKHKITRAIGAEPEVKVDFFDVAIDDISAVLMCTDGLTNMLEDSAIEEVLLSGEKVKQKVEGLVRTANENGGEDNITVVVIDSFEDEV
jgi:protein phosphatase